MEKIKSVIIYVLSVVLAFIAGLLVFIFGVLGALSETRKESDDECDDRVSYRDYYTRRRGY